MSEPTQADIFDASNATVIKKKMVRILRVYPRLSPSMLHIGLGPAVPASIWRPVLDALITDKVITREIVSAPGGRDCTVLSLSDPNYQLPN